MANCLPRRSTAFAESEYGRFYFRLLRDFGKTPKEWGTLDADQQRFLEYGGARYYAERSEAFEGFADEF